jgi:hypothetical protein
MSIFNVLFNKSPERVRGLYYPPEAGQTWANHREWAGSQRPSTEGFMAVALAATTPSSHHCRIGKITMKAING